MFRLRLVLSAAALAVLAVGSAFAATIHVDDSALGAGTGGDWANAMTSLQDALATAQSGDEIWVAEGTYRPDQGSSVTAGDRSASFALKSGVRLYGGFAGGEVTLAQRAGFFETTVLSGDLNGDDGSGAKADNSLHVVLGSGADGTARLDGFLVTAGNANQSLNDFGAGLYVQGGSPHVRRCIFRANICTQDGAAVTCRSAGDVTFVDCSFEANVAGDVGGAVWVHISVPTFVNCRFLGNRSDRLGGGVYHFNNGNAQAQYVGCLFSGNRTVERGGGIYVSSGPVAFVGCSFVRNVAGISEGGMKVSTQTVVSGSIFWTNTAPSGTAEAQQLGGGALSSVDYSCVQGWSGALGGTGNIGADPLFVDADGADNQPGTTDDDLRLDNGSPCIDAGDNGAYPADTLDVDEDGNFFEPIPIDLAGNDRFFDDPGTADTGAGAAPIVDMGALEGPANTGVVAYGSGCPGAGGFTPTLGLSGTPASGSPVTLSIDKGLGGATSLLLFGTQQASIPISAGCTLNVTPLLPLQLFIPLGGSGAGNGFSILPTVVPPGAAGAVLTMQVFVGDAASPTGFSNSKGLEVTFQ